MPNSPQTHDMRPSQLDDDVEEGWEVMVPKDKLEYLYRSHRETVKHSLQSTKALENALANVLVEVQENNSSIAELSAMVGNQSKVLAEQFAKIHSRLDKVEGNVGVDAESFGAVAKELADLNRKVDEERKARERQDSIHEDEITGVGQKAFVAVKKAEEAEQKAVKAESLVSKALSEVNTRNVAKGTFLAVVVTVIEAIVKNIDQVLKFF